MQLNQLQFLLELSREGSYSKVAKKLGVSQSTVSVAVTNLENELNCLLVERGGRRVSFTEKGQYVLTQAEEIEQNLEELINIKKTFWDEIAGEICIACASHHYMMKLIDLDINLELKYPELKINIEDNNNLEIISRVQQRHCLMGLLQINTIDKSFYKNEIQKLNLNFNFIEQGRMQFSVGPLHPMYNSKKVSLEDFLKCTTILSRYQMSDTFLNYFRNWGYRRKIIIMHDVFVSRYLVENSPEYATYLPECGLVDENLLYKQHLRTVEIEDFEWAYVVGWITRKNDYTIREKKIAQLVQMEWKAQYGEKFQIKEW